MRRLNTQLDVAVYSVMTVNHQTGFMKKLILSLTIVAGLGIASAKAGGVSVGIGLPLPGVGYGAPVAVAPAPVAPAPVYYGGYYAPVYGYGYRYYAPPVAYAAPAPAPVYPAPVYAAPFGLSFVFGSGHGCYHSHGYGGHYHH
jgi:hypothetical protein